MLFTQIVDRVARAKNITKEVIIGPSPFERAEMEEKKKLEESKNEKKEEIKNEQDGI